MPLDRMDLDEMKQVMQRAFMQAHPKPVELNMGIGALKAFDKALKQEAVKHLNMPDKKKKKNVEDFKKAVKEVHNKVGIADLGIAEPNQKVWIPAAEAQAEKELVAKAILRDEDRLKQRIGFFGQMAEQQQVNNQNLDVFMARWKEQAAVGEKVNQGIGRDRMRFINGEGEVKAKQPAKNKPEVEEFHPGGKFQDTVMISLDNTANLLAMTRLNEELGEGIIVMKNNNPVVPEQHEDIFTYWYDHYYDVLMLMKKARN